MLGRELSLFDPETHRLSVDCHAAQHPGKPSPQAIQSVGVHLVALCLTLEHGMTVEQVRPVMGELSKGRFFEPIVAGTRAEPLSDDHHRAAGRADAGDVCKPRSCMGPGDLGRLVGASWAATRMGRYDRRTGPQTSRQMTSLDVADPGCHHTPRVHATRS